MHPLIPPLHSASAGKGAQHTIASRPLFLGTAASVVASFAVPILPMTLLRFDDDVDTERCWTMLARLVAMTELDRCTG